MEYFKGIGGGNYVRRDSPNTVPSTDKTIATGVITKSNATHELIPQSGTSDILSTINGGIAGDHLFLALKNPATDTITIDNAGNIFTFDSEDILMVGDTRLHLYFDGTIWTIYGAYGSFIRKNLPATTPATEKTLVTDAFTKNNASHTLQPESGTADDLQTINGGTAGDHLFISVTDSGTDTITIKHGLGNILTQDGVDLDLEDYMWLHMYYDGTNWYIIGGSGSGSGGGAVADTTVYIGTDSKDTVEFSASAVTDEGGGKVGLITLSNILASGDPIKIWGTTNYDGNYTVDVTSTATKIVITAIYVAETFTGVERAYYRQSITNAGVQTLIDDQFKILNGHLLTFIFREGYYDFNGANDILLFEGFVGGAIDVNGEGSGYDAKPETKMVWLDFSVSSQQYAIKATYNQVINITLLRITKNAGSSRYIVYSAYSDFTGITNSYFEYVGIKGTNQRATLISQCSYASFQKLGFKDTTHCIVTNAPYILLYGIFEDYSLNEYFLQNFSVTDAKLYAGAVIFAGTIGTISPDSSAGMRVEGVETISASQVILNYGTEREIIIDTTGGAVEVDLYTADGAVEGMLKPLTFINKGSNLMTIDQASTELINGVTTPVTTSVQYGRYKLYPDGTGWIVPENITP